MTERLFTEIFRAQDFDHLVLPDRIKNVVAKGLIQNMFLYGPQGTGKSTIAGILTKNFDVLKINGSSDNGIDVIRNQVVSFATSISLEGGSEAMKVIYIDEADGLTENAWDALRETIEHYADSVRYICTCNKIDKVPAPIKSRFECIPVFPITKEEEDFVFNGYCNIVKQILDYIKVEYDDETLTQFVRNHFPDMRSILNSLQSLYIQGIHKLDKESLVKTFDCSDLLNLIMTGGDPVENYKFIMENYASSPDEALLAMSKNIVDFINMNYPQRNNMVPLFIITIAEYMRDLSTAPDRVLVLLACVYKLQMYLQQS